MIFNADALGKSFQSRSTAFAGLATIGCAIHCVLTPVIVSVAPGLGLPHEIEWGMLAVAGAFGLWTALTVPERRGLRLVAVLLGVAIWTASLSEFLHPLPEAVGSSIGAILVAASLLHASFCCRERDCEVCGDPEG